MNSCDSIPLSFKPQISSLTSQLSFIYHQSSSASLIVVSIFEIEPIAKNFEKRTTNEMLGLTILGNANTPLKT